MVVDDSQVKRQYSSTFPQNKGPETKQVDCWQGVMKMSIFNHMITVMIVLGRQERWQYRELRSRVGSLTQKANAGVEKMSRILCQEVVMLMLYLISEITVRFRREKSCFIGGGLIAPSCHHPLFFFFFKSTLGIDEPLHIKRRKVIKPGFIHSPWKSAYIRQHRIDTNWRRGELKSPKVSCWAVCRVP